MGTSNWQNISWCVQAIMRMQPQRVLDIGIGFGRWGIVLREFGEVWFGRVAPDSWTMHVEGIEAFPKNVAAYHESFYDEIHVGDAQEILFQLDDRFDLAILGDVLEHFTKSDGERILDHLIEHCDYVLVNLPLGDDWPQEEMYENPYEEHKATWDWNDFESRPVVRKAEFLDFEERRFGCVVLSRRDPRELAEGFFGSPRQGERQVGPVLPEPLPRAGRASEREAMEAIRRSGSWRLVTRLRDNALLWRLRGLLPGRGTPVTIEHRGADAATPALRVLRVESDGAPVLWDFVARKGEWSLEPRDDGAFGSVATTTDRGALLRLFDHGGRMQVVLESHPSGGRCTVRVGSRRHEVELRSDWTGPVRFDCATGTLHGAPAATSAIPHAASPPSGTATPAPRDVELSEDEHALLERLRAEAEPSLAVYVPGWSGIEQSTRNLFEHVTPLPATPTREERERLLALVAEAGCANLVLSGGALEHLYLVHDLRQRAPDTRIKLLWHGNFLQIREDYAWRGLRLAIQQGRQGLLDCLGFVKDGMPEAMRDLGLKSAFVENFVPEVPTAPSKPADGGPHLGCWISNEGWRKPPYAMAMAARRVEGAILHHAGEAKRLSQFCALVGLTSHSHSRGEELLGHDQLLRWLALMHLNLYVTVSECAPMLPLESLSVGAPCLIGPNSHLFQDDAFLKEMLVVPLVDSSDAIFRAAERAMRERSAIVEAYRRYAPGYNARARASVEEFLAS